MGKVMELELLGFKPLGEVRAGGEALRGLQVHPEHANKYQQSLHPAQHSLNKAVPNTSPLLILATALNKQPSTFEATHLSDTSDMPGSFLASASQR